jgi:hypothetical protein
VEVRNQKSEKFCQLCIREYNIAFTSS